MAHTTERGHSQPAFQRRASVAANYKGRRGTVAFRRANGATKRSESSAVDGKSSQPDAAYLKKRRMTLAASTPTRPAQNGKQTSARSGEGKGELERRVPAHLHSLNHYVEARLQHAFATVQQQVVDLVSLARKGEKKKVPAGKILHALRDASCFDLLTPQHLQWFSSLFERVDRKILRWLYYHMPLVAGQVDANGLEALLYVCSALVWVVREWSLMASSCLLQRASQSGTHAGHAGTKAVGLPLVLTHAWRTDRTSVE